jgi:beta-N-acetylhexosaminidase
VAARWLRRGRGDSSKVALIARWLPLMAFLVCGAFGLHGPSSRRPAGTPPSAPRPERAVDRLLRGLTLDQKIAQLLIVRFEGPSYSSDLDAMVHGYGAGGVVIYTVNGNIASERQLVNLIQQMRDRSGVPLAIAVDQEGGRVDRLAALRGPRLGAAAIGRTNDPSVARSAGREDARDLARLGIDVNLAPVVDIAGVFNPQLDQREYASTGPAVAEMAGAYLAGLQESGKVVGVLKHFPGMGFVAEDPHEAVSHLHRALRDLQAVDWVPYRTLIERRDVHAVMVTHVIAHAIDEAMPASLSPKVVTGTLRGTLGFDGVLISDSLTMKGASAASGIGDLAAAAVVAGSDWLIGAASAAEVAAIIDRFERAIRAGAISERRIDESVRRVLALKVRLGLVPDEPPRAAHDAPVATHVHQLEDRSASRDRRS